MANIIFRKGQKVNLRPLERADLPLLRKWQNDPEVTQYLMRTTPLMEKEEEDWFDSLHKSQNGYIVGLVDASDNKLIGTMGLHGISWTSRTATTGTVIGEKEYLGKGYGTEAKMLLLDFAFNALGLRAIMSKVMATNGRSLAYGNKCGYEEVARIPLWLRRQNGEYCDEVILIVTQERWKPLWENYLKNKNE
jgi:RimJ/RimL family protein N-acetyltransferase